MPKVGFNSKLLSKYQALQTYNPKISAARSDRLPCLAPDTMLARQRQVKKKTKKFDKRNLIKNNRRCKTLFDVDAETCEGSTITLQNVPGKAQYADSFARTSTNSEASCFLPSHCWNLPFLQVIPQ